ncbi:MAG: gfo/Idh/MocA family oxidoreductase, partial [Chloroflexi bacterium]|nr:gfo/Idh/MocA family oxidoreductase [Chloroflexota bacterium]
MGLQARSDPSVRYARDLIAQGYVGEVLTANLSVMTQTVLERGPGRIWQAVRANGANPLTIAGGHAIDALCCILGEVVELSARVTTRIT